MCSRCEEIDNKVAHYEKLRAAMTDRLTRDRIGELIERLRREKASLHPAVPPRS